jgi:uncharacterized membrane protein
MKNQLKGIALILFSILLMLAGGNDAFFDLSFAWSAIFIVIGLAGLAFVFVPDKKDE